MVEIGDLAQMFAGAPTNDHKRNRRNPHIVFIYLLARVTFIQNDNSSNIR